MSTDYVKYTAEFLYKSYNIRRSNMYNIALTLYYIHLHYIIHYITICRSQIRLLFGLLSIRLGVYLKVGKFKIR